MTKKKKIISYIICYVISALIAFAVYYVALPPINAQSVGFWIYLTFVVFLMFMPPYIVRGSFSKFFRNIDEFANKIENYCNSFTAKGKKQKEKYRKKAENTYYEKTSFWIIGIATLIPIIILGIGLLFSSTMFNAKAYSNIITVNEAVFKDDMPMTNKVTNIALMDTDTARKIGSRTLGSLSDVVSQYEVSEQYNQINYNRMPKKVSHLEYAGFFKWLGNRKNGIPGYVMVDPVNNTASYEKLQAPMKYVESGYFGDDLMRKVRFSYPTKILGEARYEIDDNGNPVFIIPCYKPQVMMFGAKDVNEVIIFDPCTGSSQIYSVTETPSWIDGVFDGYLALQKYDWKGLLSGGFINSIIGNKDCKQTTDDFGYIVIEDDVWYYTGVTSVNSDKSNIGFIISNARTGEYKFYSVIGAEEHSAMAAAEGEVQEKEYVASFPALVNISGRATYIMVLKDAGGLVKLYALVNVEKYSIVATGSTQQEAIDEYNKLLIKEGMIEDTTPQTPQETIIEMDIIVTDVKLATLNGEGVVYVSAVYNEEKCVFRKVVSEDESVMLIGVGDEIKISASKSEIDRIYNIKSWSFK